VREGVNSDAGVLDVVDEAAAYALSAGTVASEAQQGFQLPV
jgi:hypothetical protein